MKKEHNISKQKGWPMKILQDTICSDTDRKEEPGLQEIGLDDFLRSKFFKYWFWPTV